MFGALTVIGGRLKERRKQLKLTLQELADACGLTAGMISRLENARAVPSLPVLLALSRRLQLNLSELFDGVAEHADARYILVRAADQRHIEREDSVGFDYRMILERELAGYDMQVMLLHMQPGASRAPVSSDGDELIHMLSGEIDYIVGDDVIHLQTGDTLHFDGRLPHLPRPGVDPASLLALYFLRHRQ